MAPSSHHLEPPGISGRFINAFYVAIVGDPVATPGLVRVGSVRSATAPAYENCRDISITIDGTTTPAEAAMVRYRKEGTAPLVETLATGVSLPMLRAMASASTASVHFCTDQLTFDDRRRDLLKAFVAQWDRMVAEAAQQQPNGEAVTPQPATTQQAPTNNTEGPQD
jgi:hypothetical protein